MGGKPATKTESPIGAFTAGSGDVFSALDLAKWHGAACKMGRERLKGVELEDVERLSILDQIEGHIEAAKAWGNATVNGDTQAAVTASERVFVDHDGGLTLEEAIGLSANWQGLPGSLKD